MLKHATGCSFNLCVCVCVFQFLGDPHLTISHVNYKLDQVQTLTEERLQSNNICSSNAEPFVPVPVAVSLCDGGGGDYKITEGKDCL